MYQQAERKVIRMAAKRSTVRARIEPRLKREAEHVLARIGLNPTEAIRLYYHFIRQARGIPFPVHIPNAETRKAVREARRGKGRIFRNAREMDQAFGM